MSEASTRPVPYPADTRAKGWRFELDYEQIEQSDTWPLAAEIAMGQHALLMMWLIAWKQEPCGSFPADEAVIRAKCRIPPATWAKCRAVLMRGWWLAEDGRLYHDTVAKRVIEMMRRRRSDSDRQAAKRARDALESLGNHDEITRDDDVTNTGLQPESSTDNRQPTKTSEAKASDGADAPAPKSGESQKTAEELAKADLWKAAVSVLEAGGCPKAQCRTFMGKLVGDYTFPTVQKAVAAAVNEQPADAREYLKATCMRLKGERKDPLTVPSDDAARTAAALAEQARHAREVASSPTAKAAMEAVKARFGVGKREETA